jgi:hypothetical protein
MRQHRPDLSTATWRKSSHSNQDGGDCVEVADGVPGLLPVRDSKDPRRAPLLFTTPAWTAFLHTVKAGGTAGPGA